MRILNVCSRITGGFSSCCCCCDEAARDHRRSFYILNGMLNHHYCWVLKGHEVERRMQFFSLQRWRWIHWIIQLSLPVCAHLCARVRACWRSCVSSCLSIKTRWEILSCVYLIVWVVCVLLAALVCVGGSGFEAYVCYFSIFNVVFPCCFILLNWNHVKNTRVYMLYLQWQGDFRNSLETLWNRPLIWMKLVQKDLIIGHKVTSKSMFLLWNNSDHL